MALAGRAGAGGAGRLGQAAARPGGPPGARGGGGGAPLARHRLVPDAGHARYGAFFDSAVPSKTMYNFD